MADPPHPSIDVDAPFPVAPEITGRAIRIRLLVASFALFAASEAAVYFGGWWLAWVAAKGNRSDSSLGPMAASLVSLLVLVPAIIAMRRIRRTACRGRYFDAGLWVGLMIAVAVVVAAFGAVHAFMIDFGLNYRF